MGLGILEKVQMTFFLALKAASPLEEDRSIWRKGALLFHMYCHHCVPFCKGQGPHPHEAFVILPIEAASAMLRVFWFLFYCSAIPAAHRSGNTALFSNCKDGLNPNTFPSHIYHRGR